jgi:hypothetical protein
MTVTWATLFDRAGAFDVSQSDIETAVSSVAPPEQSASVPDDQGERAPEAVVADTDVLVADLFLNGHSRTALDHVRGHSWVDLVASEPLLATARAVVADLGTADLADDWYERAWRMCHIVEHPAEDTPALASAYRSGAHHLLTVDGTMAATETNLGVQPHMDLSIRPPDAFARLFDPEGVYEHLFESAYPGPDCDPRG